MVRLRLGQLDSMPPERRTYILRDLPRMLAAAGERERLWQTLSNLEFLERKLEQFGTADVLADFQPVRGERELWLIGEAIRLSAHVLDREPRLLRTHLAGRLASLGTTVQPWTDPPTTPTTWLRPLRPTMVPAGRSVSRILSGHTRTVQGLAELGDELVSVGEDGALILWDVERGQETGRLEVKAGGTTIGEEVRSLAHVPGTRTLVSNSGRGEIRVHDLDRMESRVLVPAWLKNSTGVIPVAAHPNGTRIIAATPYDGYDPESPMTYQEAHFGTWDLSTGLPTGPPVKLPSCRYSQGGPASIALDPRGRHLTTGHEDGQVHIWDADTGELLDTIEAHDEGVLGLDHLPDGKHLATASRDGTIGIFAMHETGGHGQVARLVPEPEGAFPRPDERAAIWAMCVAADGSFIAAGAANGPVLIWDLAPLSSTAAFGKDPHPSASPRRTPTEVPPLLREPPARMMPTVVRARVLGDPGGRLRSLAILDDGRRIASGYEDGSIRIWGVDGQPGNAPAAAPTPSEPAVPVHALSVERAILLPGGRGAATGSEDLVVTWDLGSGADEHVLDPDVPGGNQLVRLDAIVRPSPEPTWRNRLRRLVVARSADHAANREDVLLLACYTDTARGWDLPGGDPIPAPGGYVDERGIDMFAITDAALLSGTGRFATASNGAGVQLWELGAALSERRLMGPPVRHLAVSPDRRYLAAERAFFESLTAWDVVEDRTMFTWAPADDREARGRVECRAITFVGDHHLVVGRDDGSLQWTDITDGEPRSLTAPGAAPCVTGALPRPGTGQVLVARDGGTLTLWDLERGAEVARSAAETRFVRLAPFDSEHFLAFERGDTVRLVDWATLTEQAAFAGEGPVRSFVGAPDLGRVVVGESSGAVHVLAVERADVREANRS